MILFTVGVLGPVQEDGRRWFEVVSRHSLQSEAAIAHTQMVRSGRNPGYDPVLWNGDHDSKFVDRSESH